jgi:tRNA uridine 5-carboxymethylaminomethyl modification enzyme
MFTSRAEHRLLLREDNAVQRLSEIGSAIGLLSAESAARAAGERARAEALEGDLERFRIPASDEVNAILASRGIALLRQSVTAAELLRRPEVDWDILEALGAPVSMEPALRSSVLVDLKYRGYIARQEALVAQAERVESTMIPERLAYDAIGGLSAEVREKLARVRPRTLAQAARIPGVTPAAVSLLAVHLRRGGAATAAQARDASAAE